MTAGSDAHFGNEIGNAGIITKTDDIRKAIINKQVKIFGKRGPLINHVGTKMLKWGRKHKIF